MPAPGKYQSHVSHGLLLIYRHFFLKSIGRITKNLLLPIAENVDVIEPVAKFTDRLKGIEGVRTVYNVGLEDWKPEGVVYDFIWTQWCLNYLNDGQLVRYLEVCKTAIKPDGGIIFVKENRSTRDDDMFDEEDSSVTRYVFYGFVFLHFFVSYVC